MQTRKLPLAITYCNFRSGMVFILSYTIKKIKAKSFTLIEIVVTLIIVGIVATLAIPMFKGSIIKAKLTELLPMVLEYEIACNEILLDYGLENVVSHAPTPFPNGKHTKIIGVGANLTERYFSIQVSAKHSEVGWATICERRVYENGTKLWGIYSSHPWSKYLQEMIPQSEWF